MDDLRALQPTLLDRRRDAIVGAGDVSDGGEPTMQHVVKQTARASCDVGGRRLLYRRYVCRERIDVHMRVYKPGHQGSTAKVHNAGIQCPDLRTPDLSHDAIASQDRSRPVELTRFRVQQRGVAEKDRLGSIGLVHSPLVADRKLLVAAASNEPSGRNTTP
jgi:hypothetical protein